MKQAFKLSQERAFDNIEIKKRLNESAVKYNLYAGKKLLFIYCNKSQWNYGV